MVNAKFIQAAEETYKSLSESYNTQEEALQDLGFGPRAMKRFLQQEGSEALRPFLLGALAERFVWGIRTGTMPVDVELVLLAIGEPYPEADIEDAKDYLEFKGIEYPEDADAETLANLLEEHSEPQMSIQMSIFDLLNEMFGFEVTPDPESTTVESGDNIGG